ncbi:hypothetical protein N7509_003056 [Penicillium cosmopolitanum]|uniref:Uncharacterized protein n=1 Tax=Penicillium cosmopolitanum TaxID=1131564 RepID=A0A9W9W4A0_9EURO|nr:uncharacterized protein N7509_003056 [Penicillium cosmopolitanum]KAJ5403185.1 hypothetical protein N7509_003056 [Penicillium cosmopolitanum]
MRFNKQNFVIGDNRNLSSSSQYLEDEQPLSKGHKDDVGHIETVNSLKKSPSRTRKARDSCQKHWRRFWCIYAIASIIFLAIFLPVFFLVAVPAIAQRIVHNTNLPVYGAQILNPKPEEVSFTLQTSLKIPMGLRIHTDPLDLSLFSRDITPVEPYLTVALPAYDLKGETDMTVTKNNARILNQAQFIDTLTKAVYNKRFTLSAKGSTVGHLGALKAPLTLDKDIELDGLDRLNGFSIDSVQLLLPKEEDGTNIVGSATLPNHSVFTFALGNVTLNLKTSDLVIGQATILDVLLRPGNNKVSLRGTLDINTVLDNLEVIMEAQSDALKDGDIELSASGNSTMYNGIHISYYEEILSNLTLTTRVSILGVLGDTVQGLLDNNNSSLGNVLRNITSILGDLSGSTNISSTIQSMSALI